jgi:peptide/nickel transport system permease protein
MPPSAQHVERVLHIHKPVVERPTAQVPALPHRVTRQWRVSPAIVVCLATATVLIAAALLAPWLAPFDPTTQQLLARLRPPLPLERSLPMYALGTDELGRDLLSRCLYGMRVTMGIAAFSMLIGLCLGATIGLVSGFVGGRLDQGIMMLADIQMALPFLLVALFAVAVFGTSMPVLIAVVGIVSWASYARLVRGQVLAVKALPFIEASRALGASAWRIAVIHILPNVTAPIIVLLTLNFSNIVLLESALSFLGLGVQPPIASLGAMIGQGRDYLATAWWIIAAPAALIVVMALVVSLLGDWLRDVLEARLN